MSGDFVTPAGRTRTGQKEWPCWRFLAYVTKPVVATGIKAKRSRPLRRKA